MANSQKDLETGLTAKQEAFAQSLSEQPSLTEAYRQAYGSSGNAKLSTLHNKAWHLAKKPEVEARIKQLRAQKVVREQWTKEKLQDFIREQAMSIALNASREQDRTAALRLLGDMAMVDAFAAKKVDSTVRKLTQGDAKAKLKEALEKALASDPKVVAMPKKANG